jgi:type IV pilus assembly PilX-like protein
MAIIAALVTTLIMSALGAALVLTSSSDTRIAANFRDAQEGLHAADAALYQALDELAVMGDWSLVLRGTTGSAFVDGPPGPRTLADGSVLDLATIANLANCRRPTSCSASSLTAVTTTRPWGVNNPVWQLFAYGPMAGLAPGPAIRSSFYTVVMIADDPAENDGDPLADGDGPANSGSHTLTIRAESFGPRGAHRTIDATVARSDTDRSTIWLVTWQLST